MKGRKKEEREKEHGSLCWRKTVVDIFPLPSIKSNNTDMGHGGEHMLSLTALKRYPPKLFYRYKATLSGLFRLKMYGNCSLPE